MGSHKVSFNLPFPYPEYCYLDKPANIINDPLDWYNHVERCYSKAFAPILDAKRAVQIESCESKDFLPSSKARCLICNGGFCVGHGFSRHFNTKYATNPTQSAIGKGYRKLIRIPKGLRTKNTFSKTCSSYRSGPKKRAETAIREGVSGAYQGVTQGDQGDQGDRLGI